MAQLCCRRSNRMRFTLKAAFLCFVVWIGIMTFMQDWVENVPTEVKFERHFPSKALTPSSATKPETSSTEDKLMQQIQQERRARVRDYCRAHKINETIIGKKIFDMMVDEEHKLLYCGTYKVSSTQLKRLMAKFTNNTFQWLRNYSDEERKRVLKTHFKFMFVRQPLERLLSVFIDKMYVVRDPMYRRMWGRPILKRCRPNATAEAIENCNDITFEEFVHYVVDGGWDPHWEKCHRWCKVCAIDYDFIGQFENLQAELRLMFRAAPGVQKMPNFTRPYEMHNTTEKVIAYYSQVPRNLLLRLTNHYRSEYEMFGYPYPGAIFEQLLRNSK